MSFPLGVVAYPALVSTKPDRAKPLKPSTPKHATRDSRSQTVTSSATLGPSLFKKDSAPQLESPRSIGSGNSARSWGFSSFSRKKSIETPKSARHLFTPHSCPQPSGPQASPHDSFELAEAPGRRVPRSRPKHVPIVIPDAYSYTRHEPLDPQPAQASTPIAGVKDSPTLSALPSASHSSSDSTLSTPRHVDEIEVSNWAFPAFDSLLADSLSASSRPQPAVLPPDHRTITPERMAHSTSEAGRAIPMDAGGPRPSNRMYNNQSDSASNVNIGSAYSSQASLVGMRAEYDSASETESNHQDGSAEAQIGSRDSRADTPSQNTSGNNSHLSGLVCNVSRTTGAEPHPLVGATTTILGDKLYVFGGRRLSRVKPQVAADLYELDLVSRHWTRLEPRGELPTPRYFHSVCPLGDTKLVCYGGMSPAPAAGAHTDTLSDVVVMSDVHIYDVLTNTWAKLATPDAPQGRYAHCAAILPSAAIFSSRDAPMSAVHHNPASAHPNQGSLGVSLDGTGGAEMVVVGGQDSANHYIEQVSVFNLRSLRWTGTTGMGRSCGAYRSVVTPLTSMSVAQVGAGLHARDAIEEEGDESTSIGSGSPMLVYSNYNFLDVKLELQIRLTDGTLTEKSMQPAISPPGLRFPNGGVIDNHFVVSGTFLTSSKQEYALWTLDLRTLAWSRIDAGGVFSQGSWNRGVLWSRRNCFVVLGNRNRSLIDDYNNRRINFANVCVLELEAFGLYENPRIAAPTSSYRSASASPLSSSTDSFGRLLTSAAEDLGGLALSVREMADMEFLAIDGTRVPVNSRLICRRWGPHFITLLRESLIAASDTDTATLRPSVESHTSRNSSITITPSVNSGATTLTNNTESMELPDTRTSPPSTRPRLFYLPHTAPTLHAMLHYLYTSSLPSPPHPLATPQIFCSLLQLARPYKIDGLLEAVVERLHDCIDGRNAAAIFNAAAMCAGGGDSIQFATHEQSIRDKDIPVRTASLGGIDSFLANGAGRSAAGLRVDTEMSSGRTARNGPRPSRPSGEETDDDDVPGSASTDTSFSDAGTTPGGRSLSGRGDHEIWNGGLSAVVGLQKRGLRGLMEGRRMRERGKPDGMEASSMGLGIA